MFYVDACELLGHWHYVVVQGLAIQALKSSLLLLSWNNISLQETFAPQVAVP